VTEHDPLLDYDHDKRTIMQITIAQIEKRQRYWQEKLHDEMLKC